VSGPALPHFDAVPLFRCLNADERELLGPVCRAVAYEKGEEVFREGDKATDLCFVTIGRVKIVKAGPDRDVILGLFGAGEPIGAVAFLEGKRFPASAVALEPSTILRVPERDFFATIDAHPEMTRRLLQGLMLRQFDPFSTPYPRLREPSSRTATARTNGTTPITRNTPSAAMRAHSSVWNVPLIRYVSRRACQ
jgi:CRP-like cAMP-binding protein